MIIIIMSVRCLDVGKGLQATMHSCCIGFAASCKIFVPAFAMTKCELVEQLYPAPYGELSYWVIPLCTCRTDEVLSTVFVISASISRVSFAVRKKALLLLYLCS